MSHHGDGELSEGQVDTEVAAKPVRRKYPAEYKQRILNEIDAAQEPGEVGAILRREGLYSQLISKWRYQRQNVRLERQKPGPKANPAAQELKRLRQENERLRKRLERAELIIEVQKKVSRMLGLPDETEPDDEPR